MDQDKGGLDPCSRNLQGPFLHMLSSSQIQIFQLGLENPCTLSGKLCVVPTHPIFTPHCRGSPSPPHLPCEGDGALHSLLCPSVLPLFRYQLLQEAAPNESCPTSSTCFTAPLHVQKHLAVCPGPLGSVCMCPGSPIRPEVLWGPGLPMVHSEESCPSQRQFSLKQKPSILSI